MKIPDKKLETSLARNRSALRFILTYIRLLRAEKLLALRALLKDDAAKKMDLFLGRLSGLFREWTGKPYEPATRKEAP